MTRGRRPRRRRTVDEMRWRRSMMPTWISLVHVRHGWRRYSTVVGMPRREIEGMHSNAGRKRTGRRTSESWRAEENSISRFLHQKRANHYTTPHMDGETMIGENLSTLTPTPDPMTAMAHPSTRPWQPNPNYRMLSDSLRGVSIIPAMGLACGGKWLN